MKKVNIHRLDLCVSRLVSMRGGKEGAFAKVGCLDRDRPLMAAQVVRVRPILHPTVMLQCTAICVTDRR